MQGDQRGKHTTNVGGRLRSPTERPLSSYPVVANPPADLMLTALSGKGYRLSAYLVQYQLLAVVLDPFTNEAAWILKTAARILENFDQADCRVSFVMAGADADQSKEFLGPFATRILTFPDPDRTIVKAFALETLPALVHVGDDGTVVNAAQGWNASEWQAVTDVVASMNHWTGPVLPAAGDPGSFPGTPA